MSYILDALKKSEHERQQNQAPTVHSIYAGARPLAGQSQTPWLLIILLVLIVSGLAVSGFWWYSTNQKPLALASSSEPASLPVDAAKKPQPASMDHAEKKDSQDAVATGVLTASTGVEVESMAIDAGSVNKVAAVAVTIDEEQELLPVMQLVELPDDVRSSLPPMTYSFHVYSSDKNKCTIIINNRRYREGEVIGSGWSLDSITETGIVVRKQRYRAAIQVVDNW